MWEPRPRGDYVQDERYAAGAGWNRSGSFSFALSTVSRKDGVISSYLFHGREMLSTGPGPNFWRTPTDNDLGNDLPEWARVLKQAGPDRSLKLIRAEILENAVKIRTEFELAEIASRLKVSYRNDA